MRDSLETYHFKLSIKEKETQVLTFNNLFKMALEQSIYIFKCNPNNSYLNARLLLFKIGLC